MENFKVGEYVGFKGDIETYGVIQKIEGRCAHVGVYDSVTGDTDIHIVELYRLWRD